MALFNLVKSFTKISPLCLVKISESSRHNGDVTSKSVRFTGETVKARAQIVKHTQVSESPVKISRLFPNFEPSGNLETYLNNHPTLGIYIAPYPHTTGAIA